MHAKGDIDREEHDSSLMIKFEKSKRKEVIVC